MKESLGIPAEDKVVLYLGRVSEEKNIDEVMRYLNQYMDENANVTFLVIGDGPYRPTLEKGSKELKHHNKIIFAGAKPWDEITHYYQLADVFVSASTSETQGLTYIEALASGVPIVARKDDCLEGVLFHGINGYEFENEDTFIEGLNQILINERKTDYRKNAIESAEQFSTENFATRVENIYHHAVNTQNNLLTRMANKIVDKIGYENLYIKPLEGTMTQNMGKSYMDASRIALGCMRMNQLSVGEASKVVGAALESGITLFDHADIYGGGKSEEIFGKVISENKGMRERMRIQTKCGIRDGFYDLSSAYIISSVEDSLRRLQIDSIDVLLLHRPDALMEPDDVAEAFYQLEKSGKVKRFGISNFHAGQIEMLQEACRQPLVVNQMQFGLMHAGMIRQGLETNTMFDGGVQRDLSTLEYCRRNEITIQAWSPLQYGFIEGSFIDNPDYPELNEVLAKIANKYGVNKAAIAIAWVLRHPANMQVIVGSMNCEHIKDICKAANIKLSNREWYELYVAAGNILP